MSTKLPLHNKHFTKLWMNTMLFIFLSTIYSSILAQQSISQFIQDADLQLQLRYRFEYVDQDSFALDAKASTLRTRLGLRSGEWNGISAFIEADDVSEIGPDKYNGGGGTTPERSIYPVIADPADTRINQVYLNYQANDNIRLRVGRQRIKLDNDRFIGNVGWRQNEQTYDAASTHISHGAFNFDYAYIFNTNRIFGHKVAAGDHEHDTNIARVQWQLNPQHQLVSYFYHIDNEDSPAASNNSYGLRYQANIPFDKQQLSFTGEYAHQTDTANNPVDYDANYWHSNIQFKFSSFLSINTGFESLSGDNEPGHAFRTPLATLHAFNGWADQFLQTPTRGLQDFFSGIRGSYKKVNWQVNWHYFQTEQNHSELGYEWDTAVSFKLHESVSVLLKAAFFNSRSIAYTDTNKVWTMLTYQL